MQEHLDKLMAVAKEAAVAAVEAGYQIDYLGFQYGKDEIEVSVRVSHESVLKIERDVKF